MRALEGKVAIVTGAAAGIGAATAALLARAGASVVAADINAAGAAATAERIRAAGGSCRPCSVDVACEDQVAAMVEQAVSAYGQLDILHNNAAVTGPSLRADRGVEHMDVDLWDRISAVNARGAALGCKYAIPEMRRVGGGAIINTASAAGGLGAYERTAYGASKAALITLTRYVATQHGRESIRCNAIVPGFVVGSDPKAYLSEEYRSMLRDAMLTDFCGTPEDVAELALFLASDSSRYITGQAIWIDGGASARSQNAVAQAMMGLQ